MNMWMGLLLSFSILLMGGASLTTAEDLSNHPQILQPPYSADVQAAWKDVRKNGGFRVVEGEQTRYAVIGLGQRPTGGYQLHVERVERSPDGSLTLYVKEQTPPPGSLTTQAITYPAVVLSLPSGNSPVNVIFLHE